MKFCDDFCPSVDFLPVVDTVENGRKIEKHRERTS